MSDEQEKQEKKPRGWQRRKVGTYKCHCCQKELPFCWSCPCGFQICPECFEENKWGLSNGPTWVCPDCERIRMM